MNESAAREVVLMRSIEQTDQSHQLLSQDDRQYATKSARELAQWDAVDSKDAPMSELFLIKRAELVIKKIAERTPAFSTYARKHNGWHTLGVALPILALLFGALVDRVGDPHRVDLLSAPLLLIVVWNLIVYLYLLLHAVWPDLGKSWLPRAITGRANAGRLSHLMSRLRGKLPQNLGIALAQFNAEWLHMTARLNGYRLRRILHSSAACLAAGAILSLYMRGLLSQYHAGWESTFLNADQVHSILSLLFAPVTLLFQLPGFSVEEVRALQFTNVASPDGGARWVHLYAATLVLLVVLPRALLAAYASWRESRLSRHFTIDLGTPYFHKLIVASDPAAVRLSPKLQVYPYSFQLDVLRQQQLTLLSRRLLGEQAELQLQGSTGYGETAPALVMPAPPVMAENPDNRNETRIVCPLFNLSATPEKEEQGIFLEHLMRQHPQRLMVLVDESGLRERLGNQAGSESRLQERIALWRQFCSLYQAKANIVDLSDVARSTDDVERSLNKLAGPA